MSPAPPTHTHFCSYVSIKRNYNDNGCYATSGYEAAYTSILHLGPSCCTQRIIVHELLHSLGAVHEHTRPDR